MTTSLESDPAIRVAELAAERRAWALQILKAEADEPLLAIRERLLGWIANDNFLPPECWLQAFEVLHERQGSAAEVVPPRFLADRRQALREETHEFATGFFQMPRAARRARWEQLRAATADLPDLAAWLEQLRPGLELDESLLVAAPPNVELLLKAVCELFVLRPVERSARRRVLAEDLDWQSKSRVDVQAFWRNYPEWAALDRKLFDALGAVVVGPASVPSEYIGSFRRESVRAFAWIAGSSFTLLFLSMLGIRLALEFQLNSKPSPEPSKPHPYVRNDYGGRRYYQVPVENPADRERFEKIIRQKLDSLPQPQEQARP